MSLGHSARTGGRQGDRRQPGSEFYERAAAEPRIALLDLAGPAQQKLRRVQDALQRAQYAMGQVEHRGAMPRGMGAWDYEDQKAVHEQLAASVTSPAESLLSCAAQIIPLVTDAGTDVGRLTARTFAAYSADLAPMMAMVSELAGQTALLLHRTENVCDDLRKRVGKCSDYLASYDALLNARRFIEQANDSAISLEEGLNRLRDVSGDEVEQPITACSGCSEAAGDSAEGKTGHASRHTAGIPIWGKSQPVSQY